MKKVFVKDRNVFEKMLLFISLPWLSNELL